jgi:acetyltransferase-like isoleucine patch superfamily enzyme
MEHEKPVKFFAHESAEVSDKALIGEGTKIWNWVQVRENVKIGKNCILSKGVYIDSGVTIGDNVKIQNNVSVYHGVTIEDGVFLGPHVCFTNDKLPRAINPDGSLKNASDWIVSETVVRMGASIGANSTILSGVTIGRFALVGLGSVVSKDVEDFTLVYGNPARVHGRVDKSGKIVERFK